MQSKNQEKCDKKTIRLDKENRKKQGIRIVKIGRKYQNFMILLNTKQVCLVINFDPLLIYQKTLFR